jgi:hypothetical protein
MRVQVQHHPFVRREHALRETHPNLLAVRKGNSERG